jgi:hypothetical protein
MQSKIFILSFSFILYIHGCSVNDSPISPGRGYGDDVHYQIYSSVLNDMFSSESSYEVTLCDSTVYWEYFDNFENISESIPSLSKQTFNNYLSVNQEPVELLNIPDLNAQCNLISPDNISQWKEIFPNANVLVHLSRIGYNNAGNQALLYISEYYAPLAGAGYLVYLEKDGNWEVKQSLMLWIS